jgi:hypothetical protein
MFIEVQGTMVGFGVFTYREDGAPVFYTGAGPIQSLPFEEQRLAGYYPAHVVFSDLVETSGGPVFSIDGLAGAREAEIESAGSVRLEFAGEDTVIMRVLLTGEVPPDRPRSTTRFFGQFPFGINTFGSNGITPTRFCRPDLRGEWVFVDLSTADRPPWRFNFTELDGLPATGDITCPEVIGVQILSYRDPDRGAVLRCVETRNSPDPLDGRHKSACELRFDGSDEVVFWASRGDVGLKEITATLGAYPGSGHARGTARVNGIRIR